ncbi:helix-turn-helix domain-containing protein [Advenella kashmirensis]|nr:helix-turn-helix domain-containing protein [Advenella kashmirensis]
MATITKKASILGTLHDRSLNRFEAERIGDHCLHSTIADLRKDGHNIYSQWEVVETRFKPTRVKRYFLLRGTR